MALNFHTFLDYMPQLEQNTYSVRQVLEKMDPNVNVFKVLELGMIVKISIFWQCYLWYGQCRPELTIRRMDYYQSGGEGYYEIKYIYFQKGSLKMRHRFNQTGLKIIVDSRGEGLGLGLDNILIYIAVIGVIIYVPGRVIDVYLIYLSIHNQ